MSLNTLALVTLGQGPRPEYEILFGRCLKPFGLSPDIVSFHVLDGLTSQALADLEAKSCEPAILSRVRDERGETVSRPYSRDRMLPLVDEAVRSGRRAGADAVVICVAEHLDIAASDFPVLLPFEIMASRIRNLAEGDEKVALIPYGERQRGQQIAAWQDHGGVSSDRLVFVPADPDPVRLVADIKAKGARLGAVLAFAYATSDGVSLDAFDEAQKDAGCEILLPIRETVNRLANGRDEA